LIRSLPTSSNRAVDLLRRNGTVGQSYRFASDALLEPAKELMLGWRRGDAVRVVEIPGVTPHFTVDEWHEWHEWNELHECEIAMKQDAR